MKGVINKGIQELVEEKFGLEAWEEVKRRAGCHEPFFATHREYPDEMTADLVEAAAGALGLPPTDVLVEFGRYWVPNTGRRSYPAYFKLLGSSSRELLLNLNRVHEQVTRNLPGASPPRFEYEELPDGRLLIHYDSERRLCAVLLGLIEGVGTLFDEELSVREISCALEGDPRCTMEVSFP